MLSPVTLPPPVLCALLARIAWGKKNEKDEKIEKSVPTAIFASKSSSLTDAALVPPGVKPPEGVRAAMEGVRATRGVALVGEPTAEPASLPKPSSADFFILSALLRAMSSSGVLGVATTFWGVAGAIRAALARRCALRARIAASGSFSSSTAPYTCVNLNKKERGSTSFGVVGAAVEDPKETGVFPEFARIGSCDGVPVTVGVCKRARSKTKRKG